MKGAEVDRERVEDLVVDSEARCVSVVRSEAGLGSH